MLLLFRSLLQPVAVLPEVHGRKVVGGGFRAPRFFDVWAHEQEALAKLHQDDQLATELLVSIVLKGFFDGAHQHSSP